MTTRVKLKVESIKHISPNPGGKAVHVATLIPVTSRDIDQQTGKRVSSSIPWARLTVMVTDPEIAEALHKGHYFHMELTEIQPAAA